ncbi:unnamed protein product [Mytilus coruscus]|uniref:Uncharacterized protein n=1 Tax=Mytilus coruscus TaxID=42192 RepID=A0A6J8DII9_MYTCO|nr:unnamed protein product [Mytilus coruscus]
MNITGIIRRTITEYIQKSCWSINFNTNNNRVYTEVLLEYQLQHKQLQSIYRSLVGVSTSTRTVTEYIQKSCWSINFNTNNNRVYTEVLLEYQLQHEQLQSIYRRLVGVSTSTRTITEYIQKSCWSINFNTNNYRVYTEVLLEYQLQHKQLQSIYRSLVGVSTSTRTITEYIQKSCWSINFNTNNYRVYTEVLLEYQLQNELQNTNCNF